MKINFFKKKTKEDFSPTEPCEGCISRKCNGCKNKNNYKNSSHKKSYTVTTDAIGNTWAYTDTTSGNIAEYTYAMDEEEFWGE